MTEQATSDCTRVGATTEAHESIARFAGTFRAHVKMWMGPGEPHESTGVMTNTMELGGRYLQQVYEGDASDGPFPDFEGRGYWGYSTLDNVYQGIWMDTACTCIQSEVGSVDPTGKVWTMRGEMTNPMGPGTLRKRTVITYIDKDHHTMESYFTAPDGKEAKSMEIRYERKR